MVTLNIYMKRLTALLKKNRGFTLIELLVVIGILGILAAALIATIDPFEQLKKADDAKIKNIVVEFQTANVRYYTTHGAFPWNDANSTNANCTGFPSPDITSAPLATGNILDCINGASGSLIAEGELKSGFATNTNDLNKIYLNWSSTDATNMIVCFSPTSKSQKASPETIYDSAGADNSASCPDASAADGTCFWCTR